MAGYPYLFCRYAIQSDDELLDAAGQRQFFTENQGQGVAYRRWGARESDATIQIMEPRSHQINGIDLISTLIGIAPGTRTVIGYDPANQSRTRQSVDDTHIKVSHLVLVPSISALAILDRSSDFCVPARAGLRITRAIIREIIGTDGDFIVSHLNDDEVKHAISTWALTDYQYTVRPLNPVQLSDLTNMRSDAMKAENVARETAHLHAPAGGTMQPNQGPIFQTQEMVDAGYGQNGFKGITPDGHVGHVPKPAFHMDKQKNLAERDKPRFVRIIFGSSEDEGGEHALAETIGSALLNFYGDNG